MAVIAPEDTVILNPEDAADMGIVNGDTVTMGPAQDDRSFPAGVSKAIPRGIALLRSSVKDLALADSPQAVELLAPTVAKKKKSSARKKPCSK
jgi:anaerobic selenocysteine-containing dehydrogenase